MPLYLIIAPPCVGVFQKTEIKRNLRLFSGWEFSKDSDLYKKKINYLEK